MLEGLKEFGLEEAPPRGRLEKEGIISRSPRKEGNDALLHIPVSVRRSVSFHEDAWTVEVEIRTLDGGDLVDRIIWGVTATNPEDAFRNHEDTIEAVLHI